MPEQPGRREAESEARAINLAIDVRAAGSDEAAAQLLKGKEGIWDEVLQQEGGADIIQEAAHEARAAGDDTEAATILSNKLEGLRGSPWDRLLDQADARDQGEE